MSNFQISGLKHQHLTDAIFFERVPNTCPAAPTPPHSSLPLVSPKPSQIPNLPNGGERIGSKIEMQMPPRTLVLPPASGPRGNKAPSLLSPSYYSWRAFPVATAAASASPAASAGGDQDAAVSEHPCVRTPYPRAMPPPLSPLSFLGRDACALTRLTAGRAARPPAFLLFRSGCPSGGWRGWKGTTRRSPSGDYMKGEHFFTKRAPASCQA